MALSKAYGTGVSATASGTSLTTGTFDSTGYTHIVVGFGFEGADTTITPSDNKSSTFTLVGKEVASVGEATVTAMYFAPISAGTGHTVTLTLAAARGYRNIAVWLVNASNGNGLELDVKVQATNDSVGTGDAGDLVTTVADTVMFHMATSFFTENGTPGTGWTEDDEPAVNLSYAYAQSRTATSTGTYPAEWTPSGSDDMTNVAAAFNEIAGGGGGLEIELAYHHLFNTQKKKRA